MWSKARLHLRLLVSRGLPSRRAISRCLQTHWQTMRLSLIFILVITSTAPTLAHGAPPALPKVANHPKPLVVSDVLLPGLCIASTVFYLLSWISVILPPTRRMTRLIVLVTSLVGESIVFGIALSAQSNTWTSSNRTLQVRNKGVWLGKSWGAIFFQPAATEGPKRSSPSSKTSLQMLAYIMICTSLVFVAVLEFLVEYACRVAGP